MVNPEQGLFSSKVFRAIARRFWGSELGADFSTYDGKGLAAMMIHFTIKSLPDCDKKQADS